MNDDYLLADTIRWTRAQADILAWQMDRDQDIFNHRRTHRPNEPLED
jgi:hypothetical protein